MPSYHNTPHKTFNTQAEYIGKGNVMGTCQMSTFIRGKSVTECNGQQFAQGVLQSADVGYFKLAPRWVVEEAKREADVLGAVILYEFRIWRNKTKAVIGYICTTSDGHKLFATTGRTTKHRAVLDYVANIVAN